MELLKYQKQTSTSATVLEALLDRRVGMQALLTLSFDPDVDVPGVALDKETMFSMAMASGCTLHIVTAAGLETSSQNVRWIASQTESKAIPNTAHRSFAERVLKILCAVVTMIA